MEQAAFPSQLPVAVVPAQVCSNLAGPEEGETFPKQPSAFVLAGGGERKGKKIEGKARQMVGAGGRTRTSQKNKEWLCGAGYLEMVSEVLACSTEGWVCCAEMTFHSLFCIFTGG